MTDKDGYNTYFNQQWYDFTGLTPAESLGNGWSNFLHPDDRGTVPADLGTRSADADSLRD